MKFYLFNNKKIKSDIFSILISKEIKGMNLSKNDFVRVKRNKFRLIDDDYLNTILFYIEDILKYFIN